MLSIHTWYVHLYLNNKALSSLEEDGSPLRTCANFLGKGSAPFPPMMSQYPRMMSVSVHSTDAQRASGCTYHSGLGVPLPSVAEGGGQSGGAALVIQGCPAVVDCRVDGDGPHAGGVAIAVAVVVAATVPRGPHIDAAFAPSAL